MIQPTSYVHSIVKFYGGTIHYLSHNPMEIPIFNSITDNTFQKNFLSSSLNLKLLNNLMIKEVPYEKFLN